MILIESPAVLFLSFFIFAITAVLTRFQTEAYLSAGIGELSLWLALICESCLIVLAIFFSSGRQRLLMGAFFVGMFSYSLGSMSYDLKSQQQQEHHKTHFESANTEAIRASLSQTQEALALAIKRQESGNVAKHAASVTELTNLLTKSNIFAGDSLIEYKFNGLIVLRALLMLINAFLVHSLMRLITERSRALATSAGL